MLRSAVWARWHRIRWRACCGISRTRCAVTERIAFLLDGETVTANPGETLWAVAHRLGKTLPHLCHRPAEAGRHPGLEPAGNCRACMVEIEGERTLAASCCREVRPGLVVHTQSERARLARRMVLELLAREAGRATQMLAPASELTRWCEREGVALPPPDAGQRDAVDTSHPAIAVNLSACIACMRCVRACRDLQGNDVIAIAGHGRTTRIVFDDDRPLGASSCVACGECVEACPTGALAPAHDALRQPIARTVDTVCPYCGVGCQLTLHVGQDERIAYVTGRDGPANHGRLCVKGRYGFDYVHHASRLTHPWIRRPDAAKDVADIERFERGEITLQDRFHPASWAEALDAAAFGFRTRRDAARAAGKPPPLAGFGSAKGSNEEAYLFQKLVRVGFATHNVDHCTRLCHASSVAALLEGIGSGAVSNPVADVAQAEVILLIGANPSANHPVAASWIKNAVRRGATCSAIIAP
ncbi:MAG: 2Fe-2S iron-sulfur cluster-binding protein, partial [Casimicrobiaceae bacterium]